MTLMTVWRVKFWNLQVILKFTLYSDEDVSALQYRYDLCNLVKWSKEWQMLFNADKCQVMHAGYNNSPGTVRAIVNKTDQCQWRNSSSNLNDKIYIPPTSKQGTVNCLQFFTVNYMQYGSSGITTYSAYNLTYSAYSEITRKLFGLHCQWSGGALSDEGDGVAAMRSGPWACW